MTRQGQTTNAAPPSSDVQSPVRTHTAAASDRITCCTLHDVGSTRNTKLNVLQGMRCHDTGRRRVCISGAASTGPVGQRKQLQVLCRVLLNCNNGNTTDHSRVLRANQQLQDLQVPMQTYRTTRTPSTHIHYARQRMSASMHVCVPYRHHGLKVEFASTMC